MQEELLGYLFQALDEEESRRVEEVLRANREAVSMLEVLRRGLVPLKLASNSLPAPAGLAVRTCIRVRAVVTLRQGTGGSETSSEG